MIRLCIVFVAWLAVADKGLAQSDAVTKARDAAEALTNASQALAEAENADDRIGALTRTILAYEEGLSALRAGLRQAALKERQVEERLVEQESELGDLLVLLQNVSRAERARSVLHPGSAIETVHAGLLTSALVPALEERTSALGQDLSNLSALRAVREAGVETLEEGVAQVRRARLALSQALSERTDLPASLATDEAAIEALINSSETLAAFADNLSVNEGGGGLGKRDWPLPAAGVLLRKFNEADPEGQRRPGWIVATEPDALLTSPVEATVRFAGYIPSTGQVIVLETAPGTLVILTGHDRSFAVRDQIVAAGEPIALMGGGEALTQENLNETMLLGGQRRSETLYIEIRQRQAPVDPTAFFRPPMQ